MNADSLKYKTSSQKKIILSLILIFLVAVLMICILMYRAFTHHLTDELQKYAIETIDIIDYMAQTSGESPELNKGIKTLAANRDIKLIIIRIDDPPVVIASNKTALIGLPTNEIFSNIEGTPSFSFSSNSDLFTAVSSIWLENKFNNGQFTKASVGVIFDTYKMRILLQEQVLYISYYLILTLIFAIGIVYFLTRKFIFKPLEAINSSLNNNNSQNKFTHIPITRNDEIGAVANSFNQLFSDLYDSKRNLRENTERYDLALQGTKVGLVDWNIVTGNLHCSSSLKSILGIKKKDFSPSIEWLHDRTHDEDKELARTSLISHLKFNTEYDIEGRLRHENGEYIWIRARGQAVRDQEGVAIRMVGYYVDISKLKANEHLLNSLYLLSANATTSLSDKINYILNEGLNYLDLDCGIICSMDNESYSVLYSQCPDEYLINNKTIFESKDTLCSFTAKKNEVLALHDVSKTNYSNIASHTKFCVNSYIGMPLYVHGKIFGTVSFFANKSRLKPFEEREKSFVRLISQWIGNEMMRTQYIDYLHETESRLEDAVEELTNANSELENFTHVASHDLQEPLRMITNFAGLLKINYSDGLDNTAKEYLNILSTSANQMRMLINDLLDYAHASKENEKIENLDLNNILNYVFANLEKQIRESHAKIIYSKLPNIRANKTSIICLLQNFISNAIKFQAINNQPIIEIKAFQNTAAWVIAVSDNGIGIDIKYQSNIFEPFKRLHAKSEYEGTGIGLAVCNKIIARMGGTMWIESEKGTGSTFFVSIPTLMTQADKAA